MVWSGDACVVSVSGSLAAVRREGKLVVLDQTAVELSLQPRAVCQEKMVLMVLSAPANREKREAMRERLVNTTDVRLIFLLGASPLYQAQLEEEHERFDDLLQTSVRDSYDTLSYKSLSGFIWISGECERAKLITKTDDDVTLDLSFLVSTLTAKYGDDPPPTIECPAVIRNMRPLKRNHRGTIFAKFFISRAELGRRVYPDLCFGWIYVTTPRVGLALAEVAAARPGELRARSDRDDYFITGFLRERLPWVQVRQLEGGLSGLLWDHVLSQCTWLAVTKNVFFNKFVRRKSSGSVSYVQVTHRLSLCPSIPPSPPPSPSQGWRMYGCIIWEFYIMGAAEWTLPTATQAWIENLQFCLR